MFWVRSTAVNTTTFIVYFKSPGTVTVRAFNQAEARILAQAERIKAGKEYAIDRVEEVSKEH